MSIFHVAVANVTTKIRLARLERTANYADNTDTETIETLVIREICLIRSHSDSK